LHTLIAFKPLSEGSSANLNVFLRSVKIRRRSRPVRASNKAYMTVDRDVPQIFLLIENKRKGNNLGPILRCACAFGIKLIVVVGFELCSVEGSHGASKHVAVKGFPTADQAVGYVRNELCCSTIVGLMGSYAELYSTDGYSVRVDDDAQHADDSEIISAAGDNKVESTLQAKSFPIGSAPFQKGNMCIVLSKQPRGLLETLARVCSFFVHVAHAEINDTTEAPPLLDIQSSLSILLHHYTNWAGFCEHNFDGSKYNVVQAKVAEETAKQHRQQRERERHLRELETDTLGDRMSVSVFDCGQAHEAGDY
jgi:tRNA G18 (ribose-2'-O)-methylase SpoU